MKDARDGPQYVPLQNARVKRVPVAASRSMFGVRTTLFPYDESAVAVRSSEMMKRTLGGGGAAARSRAQGARSRRTRRRSMVERSSVIAPVAPSFQLGRCIKQAELEAQPHRRGVQGSFGFSGARLVGSTGYTAPCFSSEAVRLCMSRLSSAGRDAARLVCSNGSRARS